MQVSRGARALGAGLCWLWLGACGGAPAIDDAAAMEPAAHDPGDDGTSDAAALPAAPRFGTFGFDTEGMDPSVAPGDDFNRFANGTWLDQTPIPSDRARFGMFDLLALEAEEHVNTLILEISEAGGAPGTNERRIADLYASWMDEAAIEERGLAPVRPWLERIAAVASHEEAARLMGEREFFAPYWISISPDPADPTVYAVRSGQSGLGMPTREYYLDPAPRFVEYRAAYLVYLATLHELAGFDDAAGRAERILALETRIAEGHWTRERSREVTETYNVLTVDDFVALAPTLRLGDALASYGLAGVDKVIVAQPSAIADADAVFAETDLATIREWLAFHFLSSRATWLPRAFDEAQFAFFGRTLSGTETLRPRDRRGADLVGRALGHAIGRVYVARHFPPASYDLMQELVQNLIVAFRGRLENLAWMDDATRAEALAKLATFEAKIGYPEIWDSYEGLDVAPDDLFGNRMRIADHEWNELLARFPEPVDRRRWFWPPQIVNASYYAVMNQITFPAGILQAPFFDPNADPAMNYGAIGAVIGHEIGHGFDDQGRRYDADGRIRDWWTEETNERFVAASDRLAAQFSAFCPLEDLCVNGRLALGENIGDLGGLQMAYAAWRAYVESRWPGEDAPVIDGFTGDQRFFLAWAQIWRSLYREDALRSQLVNGPHAPGAYRINGAVRNLDAWYEAFGVTEDHALWLAPEDRVRIW